MMSKAYAISFDKKMGIVIVQVVGMASEDDHYEARDESLRLCQENNCLKLLVDLRELNTKHYSTMGCFSFGESLSSLASGIKIAHVLPIDLKSKEDATFTVTVEVNRGALSREFDNIDKAKKWLLES